MTIGERPTYVGVGDIEKDLRDLHEDELLAVLAAVGDQLESLGVNTSIPQLIMDGIHEGGDRPYQTERYGEQEILPVNFLLSLYRREPSLFNNLSHEDFGDLVDAITTLSMVCCVLLQKHVEIDYQRAGFSPDFGEHK